MPEHSSARPEPLDPDFEPNAVVYEADEAVLRIEAPRVRRDLVDPPAGPAASGEPELEPAPERPGPQVSVRLEPDGTITRVTFSR